MTSFSVCFWISSLNGSKPANGSIISYCVWGSAYCNTIAVTLDKNELLYWDGNNLEWVAYQMQHEITDRSHICLVIDHSALEIYINDTAIPDTKYISPYVPGGGVLIFGQNQDYYVDGVSPGTPVHIYQGFYGIMERLRIWNRALIAYEIERMYECDGNSCVDDAIVIVNQSNACVQGHVIADCCLRCPAV